MAINIPTNFNVEDSFFLTGYAERISQNIDILGARSNGTMMVTSQVYQGDEAHGDFFPRISGSVTRRDPNSTAVAATVNLTEARESRARLSRKFGPFDTTYSVERARTFSMEDIELELGRKMAEDQMADQVNTAIASAVGALSNTGTIVNVSGTSNTLTHARLVEAMRLMGDQMDAIRAWVMHSSAYYDLVEHAIDPAATVDEVGAATIYGGGPGTFNKPVIVTDSDNLLIGGDPDKLIMGLTAGAITVENQGVPKYILDPITGLENLVIRAQGEWDYFVKVMGHAYDLSAGGANPTDATLAAAANWNRTLTEVKNGPGVILRVD